jgi:energy-coupling factor transporter ATP-binding protein EcfA2
MIRRWMINAAVVGTLTSTESMESAMFDNTPPPKFSYVNADHMLLIQGIGSTLATTVWNQVVSISRIKFGLSCTHERETYATQDYVADTNKCMDFLRARGYVTWMNQDVGLAILDDTTGHYADTFVLVTTHSKTITIEIHGNPDTVNNLLPEFSTLLEPLGTLIYTASSVDLNGQLQADRSHLSKDDSNVARDSFFPWLSVSLDDYFKAFMESDESVLVMFGPPGTGKSTFLRSLILSGNHTSMLAYNKNVVQSPATLRWFYSRNNVKILAYEDIDTHLGSREDGNALMSTILNGAEGILSHPGKKLIFSTNLESIDKIDPALLRVGRCFDILQFHNLTPTQGNAVLADLGREPKDLSSKEKWSLAEVLSKKNPAQQRINRFSKKVGFL